MKWIEIAVTTTLLAAEAVSELMMRMGANGTEMVDPYAFRQVLKTNSYLDFADDGLVESYGSDVIVKAYFSSDRNIHELCNKIQSSIMEMSGYLDIGQGKLEYSIRDDSEWKDSWKQYFKPFNFTNKIVVKPSWEDYSPKKGEIVIEMDPGMAFGTGTHETTKMCAMLGEKYLKPGDRVLDLGCGTAILAISALKLGAGSATAVDIDDAAVNTARSNAEKNQVENKIKIIRGELKEIPKEPYDLIFINIIADIILSLSSEIKGYIGDNTRILLSGIIKERQNEVKKTYLDLGFSLVEEFSMGEWTALVFHA